MAFAKRVWRIIRLAAGSIPSCTKLKNIHNPIFYPETTQVWKRTKLMKDQVMNQKTFYVTSCLLAAMLMGVATLHAANRKPNFLFIYTDDQRWDAMGVVQREQGQRARFPWFKSPNMDRLAAGGVRFRNAFVTLSLCSPSRAAFLTGRYNHINGITNNHTEFPADSVTHATLLRAAGYRTAYLGKWHMGEQRGQPHDWRYSTNGDQTS